MKKLIAILILLIPSISLADDKPTGAVIYFDAVTAVAGGTFTNADSSPTWTLIKNGSTVISTGTFTVTGTGTLAANYYGSLTLNSATFSVGDWYRIEGTATISSIPVKSIVRSGRVLPAEVVAGEALVYSGGGTINNAGSLISPADSAGITTLLTRLPSAITLSGGRVTAGGGTIDNAGSLITTTDSSGISTLLTRLPSALSISAGAVTVGTNNDKTGYALTITPPTAAQVTTSVWTALTSGSDFNTVGSVGTLVKNNLDATVSSRSTFAAGGNVNVNTVTAGAFGSTAFTANALSALTVLNATNLTNAPPDSAGVTTLLTRLPGVATINSSGTLSIGANALHLTMGNVTVGGYAAGQSPASLILTTPANKLTTDSSGRVQIQVGTGTGQLNTLSGAVTVRGSR